MRSLICYYLIKKENKHRDVMDGRHSPSGYNTLVDYQKLDEDSDETLMVT